MNLEKITSSLLTTSCKEEIFDFVYDREGSINCWKAGRFVKSFFVNNDFVLVLHDAISEKPQTTLFLVKDFAQNEDTLIELAGVFRNINVAASQYNIYKYAKQAVEEVIGMVPTFEVLFRTQRSTYESFDYTIFGECELRLAA
jgi:hypothetical protein